MRYEEHIAAVEAEVATAVEAAAAGPPDARVPTCPDFAVSDLLAHVGEFCGLWTHVVCEGLGRPKTPFPDLPGPADRPAWLEGLGRHLVDVLGEASADTPCWTWHEPDQSAGFIARRCAHELAIHRVDLQAARDAVTPVDAALAVDGIEEVIFMIGVGGPDGEPGPHGNGETLHLHGTDHESAEWLFTLEPSGVTVVREHAKGDLALKGPVSDLEMLLYQRPTVGEVQRFGDESVLGVFHGEFTFG